MGGHECWRWTGIDADHADRVRFVNNKLEVFDAGQQKWRPLWKDNGEEQLQKRLESIEDNELNYEMNIRDGSHIKCSCGAVIKKQITKLMAHAATHKTRRRLTNQSLIDRFIRESIRCQ